MNVPLRALSWAIRFFWLITFAFAVTCAYSATQIGVEFGEPTPILDGTSFGATLPIMLNNKGYYSISDLNITTTIFDAQNTPISESTSHIAEIPPQNEITIPHNVSFDLNKILTRADYLFNDSNLTLHGSIHLNYASLIPLGVEADTAMPWGAPLFNFVAGTPHISAYDVTRQDVSIPVSFENHSPYIAVTGTMRIEVFNSRNQLLGEDMISVDVQPGNSFSGEVEILVNPAMVTPRGEIHVYFDTEAFDYGPLVIGYG
jgi:hypothetical protein